MHSAWQRLQAHGKAWRTAKAPQRTAKPRRTAKALPCDFCATHGKDSFAGRIFAGQTLPCTAARQRLCRADYRLCRAIWAHGNVLFSRSAYMGKPTTIVTDETAPLSQMTPEAGHRHEPTRRAHRPTRKHQGCAQQETLRVQNMKQAIPGCILY
jgi:hypothetical protein